MGASGKMDAEIPPDAGEQCLRFRLRPAVRVLASIQLSAPPPWRTAPLVCTRNDHVGGLEPFNVVLGTEDTEADGL